MKRAFRTVQFLANIAVINLALIGSIVLVKQYFFGSQQPTETAIKTQQANLSKQPAARSQEDVIGKSMTLENVNWKENKKTVILYLSTTCRYCNESVTFYQRLVKENAGNKVKLVAVFPQPLNESREYLGSNEISVDRLFSDSLKSIGVTATPTLLLVNGEGIVTDHWRGKLTKDTEEEVISRL